MEGSATAAGGTGGGAGGRSAAGSGLAAAGEVVAASCNVAAGGAAEGVVATYSYGRLLVPAAARPWFLAHGSDGDKVPVTVYGRQPDGPVKPYNATLNTQTKRWRLSGIVTLLNDLDVHKGDRVRLTREEVAAAAGLGAAAGTVMGVVTDKVAGQQEGRDQQEAQQQHHRRHVRTAVHIGTLKPVTTMLRPDQEHARSS